MRRQAGYLLLTIVSAGRLYAAAASVQLTSVPPYGSTNYLAGRVHGVDPASHRVAVLIYIASAGGWFTKPTCAAPLTTIQSDGTWSANITTGGADSNATRLVAYVVPASFSQPCVLGQECLPDEFVTQSVANAVADRIDPALRSFHWSAMDWWVKSGTGLLGPGPNYFSDSVSNVWLDTQNRLHLRILQSNGVWQCAEITSAQTPGYGTYTFRLATPIDLLDLNAVLGLFTYSDNPAENYREIDVECSRWSNATDTNNSQFVVQPAGQPNHLVRYRVETLVTNSVHAFTWQPTNIAFMASAGTNTIAQWTYTNTVPTSCDEHVHLNLWLFRGQAPTNGLPVEVIVEPVDFQGIDSDGDGLPDAWERAHNLNPYDSTDAARDDDGDGFSNLQEYLANTDPADAQSALRITAINRAGTNTTISFTSVLDKTYILDGAVQLPATSWSVIVSNVAGTGATIAIIDAGTNRFYRIRVQP